MPMVLPPAVNVLKKRYTSSSLYATDSLCHQLVSVYATGDFVSTEYYTSGSSNDSGCTWVVYSVRSSEYTGSVGTFSSDGCLEGLWHRFKPIVSGGGLIDIRKLGVACTEGTTGWHSRFENIMTWAAANNITLTGYGVLSCTETVNINRAFFDGEKLRFQGGTAALTGGVVGPSTFFTASQSNREVTFTLGSPLVVNLASHGLSANAEIYFGVSQGGRLPSGLQFLLKYYVKDVLTDGTFTISTTSGGVAINSTTGFSGTFYLFQAGTQSSITTVDVMEESGKLVRLGVVVKAGFNGSNRDYMRHKITVWGDGNSDRTTPPSTINILHDSDDSPNANYDYTVNYGYIGVALNSSNEKNELVVRGIYDRHLCYNLKTSGSDTLPVYLFSNNCQHWYTEAEGIETSLNVILNVENRDDPATDSGSLAGPLSAAILIRNGKTTTLSGRYRAHNGRCGIKATAGTNSTGGSNRAWASTLMFNNLELVHGYETAIDLEAVKYVYGAVTIKDWANSGSNTFPCLKVGRVVNAGGLRVAMEEIQNAVGVVFGDATYYSRDAHLGHYNIDMGVLLQFATYNYPPGELTGASGNPTTLTAWEVVKSKNCVIDMTGTRGCGIIDADVTENCVVQLCHISSQYTITKHASAVATYGKPTLV